MKIGASVASYTTTWDDIAAAIRTLETGRWDSVWFPDHFIPPSAWKGAENEPIYEAWTLVAAVAGMTEKLRLGHLVSGNTYRNPALVAKMATTIDQVSHGRFTLSVGAAWLKREHEAYGWVFPSMRERQDRFEEACALIRALFTADGQPVDFQGRYYSLDSAPLSPGSYRSLTYRSWWADWASVGHCARWQGTAMCGTWTDSRWDARMPGVLAGCP